MALKRINMKKYLSFITLSLAISSCAQQQKESNSPLDKTLQSVTGNIENQSTDSVTNTSFITSNGEKFLRLEIVVNDSLEDVWKIFTTEQGLKSWMSPVVQLDFRIGGMLQTNYDKNAKIGDKGTTGDIHDFNPCSVVKIFQTSSIESFTTISKRRNFSPLDVMKDVLVTLSVDEFSLLPVTD